MTEVRVALSATTQSWRSQLHEHIRDHVFGMTATTVRDARQVRGDHPRAGQARGFDVVVIDDVMRIFGAADIGTAQDRGTRFIGLYDLTEGRGQPYLLDLGVDLILPVTTPISELIAAIQRLGPAREEEPPPPAIMAAANEAVHGRRGSLTVVTRACGGVGSTETTIALVDQLSRSRRTLLIEADELGPSAAQRLRRDPDCGLARALGRVAHGHKAFPEGVSPPAREGVVVGRFDAICGTSVPGGPPLLNPYELMALLDEAVEIYDEVVVETTMLITATSDVGRDRFAAGRMALGRADRILVLTRPDGDGAMQLVNWVSAASSVGAVGPVWAAFGRTPRSRYQRANLMEAVATCVPSGTFEAVHYLPEDPAVLKAKWNADLVRRGRWLVAVQALTRDLIAMTHGRLVNRATVRRPAGSSDRVRSGARP